MDVIRRKRFDFLAKKTWRLICIFPYATFILPGAIIFVRHPPLHRAGWNGRETEFSGKHNIFYRKKPFINLHIPVSVIQLSRRDRDWEWEMDGIRQKSFVFLTGKTSD